MMTNKTLQAAYKDRKLLITNDGKKWETPSIMNCYGDALIKDKNGKKHLPIQQLKTIYKAEVSRNITFLSIISSFFLNYHLFFLSI